ncbi:MAG: invasion associated locus B family protein [Magnetococcales bacterium]|nr:invasion associated locus B family protein [Magnetococcales bacterium]
MSSFGTVTVMLSNIVVWTVFLLFSDQAWSEIKKEKEITSSREQVESSRASTSASTNLLHGKVFGKWEIVCEMPSGREREKCYANQNQISTENKVRVLKFSVGRLGAKDEWVAVAVVPLGISIPTGLAFKVDKNSQMSMQLQQCTGEGCVAVLVLEKQVLTTMRAGKVLHVGMVPFGSKKTLEIQVDLNGFSAVLEPLSK